MSAHSPIDAGRVEWAGDNPGIYLKDSSDGDWTRLYVPQPGTYHIGGTYALIRGTQCDKAQIKDGSGREPSGT